MTELLDKRGHDVVVAVHINRTTKDRSKITKIASLYSKTNKYGENRIETYVNDQIQKNNLIEEYYQDWRHPDSKRFHNLKYIEKVGEITTKKAADNLEGRQDFEESRAVSFDETSATTYNIADLYEFVKTYDDEFSPAPEVSEFALNADGTPKVFYHGTNQGMLIQMLNRKTMPIKV